MLMVMRGLSPRDLVAGLFGFVEQRDGNLCDSRAALLKLAKGSVENRADFRREHIKKEFFGQSKLELTNVRKDFPRGPGTLAQQARLTGDVKKDGYVVSRTRD